MDDLLAATRFVLAAVFVMAGTTKVVDRSTTRASVTGFGVPAPLVGAIAALLPVAELGLGALLLPVRSAPWAGAGLAVLLSVFLVVMVHNLCRGRRPPCGCFGEVSPAPIGAASVARNAVLLVATVFVAAAGERPAAELFAGGPAVDVVVVATLVGVVVLLFRRGSPVDADARSISAASAGTAVPAVGHRVPAVTFTRVDGRTMTLDDLLAGDVPVLVVSANTSCGSCTALYPVLAAWQREQADMMTVVPLITGDPVTAAETADEHGLAAACLDVDRTVSTALGLQGSPAALLLTADGRVGATAVGADAVRRLAGRVADGFDPSQSRPYTASPALEPLADDLRGPAEGSPAPMFTLPTRTGEPFVSSSLAGSPSVTVFLDAAIPPADGLIEALSVAPEQEQRVVVIVVGTADTDGLGILPLPVLVDHLGAVAMAFGIVGTPSAVALGPDLTIAGPVVEGVDAVRALLMDRHEPAPMVPVSEVDERFVPRQAAHVSTVLTNGAVLVIDGPRGSVHRLDGLGGLVWDYFDGERTIEEIADELSGDFGAEPAVVLADVLDLTRRLGGMGLLRGVAPKESDWSSTQDHGAAPDPDPADPSAAVPTGTSSR